jgi:zinc and cadmium transporter
MDATLFWIIGAGLAGGAVSLLLAAAVTYSLLSAWVPRMVSFSVGVLLGVAFLSLLPEAFEGSADAQTQFGVVLAGLLAFFLLEKATLWRHGHDHGEEATRASSGLLILVGDAFHNFVDGVLIAAAFLTDFRLGVATTLAVMAHEIPQELGDFAVLLKAGYGRKRALLLNLAVSLASVLGGIAGYFALEGAQAVVQYALLIAASCFIYIAVADLIPDMHRQNSAREIGWQLGLMAAGIAIIWAVESAANV